MQAILAIIGLVFAETLAKALLGKGSYNLTLGSIGRPFSSSISYVRSYRRKDGTFVKSHIRRNR